MNKTVEQNEWKKFLNDFSRLNEERLVRLEIVSAEFGANNEAKNLPLLGISFEEKGSEIGDVLISLGGSNDEGAAYVTHTRKDAKSITSSRGGDGVDVALEITGAEGENAILIFE